MSAPPAPQTPSKLPRSIPLSLSPLPKVANLSQVGSPQMQQTLKGNKPTYDNVPAAPATSNAPPATQGGRRRKSRKMRKVRKAKKGTRKH